MSAILLSAAGFLLLGLATDQHHRRRFGSLPGRARRTWMRAGGWTALAAGAIPALFVHGPIFGPVFWAGAVMAGAAIAFLALNLLPGRRPG